MSSPPPPPPPLSLSGKLQVLCHHEGGAGSRVVESLGTKQEVPFRISVPPKMLGSYGIICKYLPSWVNPMFSMRVYSLFRFVLTN